MKAAKESFKFRIARQQNRQERDLPDHESPDVTDDTVQSEQTATEPESFREQRRRRDVEDHGGDDSVDLDIPLAIDFPGAHPIPGWAGTGTPDGDTDMEDTESGESSPNVTQNQSGATHTATDHEIEQVVISAVLINEEEEEARRQLEMVEKLQKEAIVADVVDEENQRKLEQRKRLCWLAATVCILSTITVIIVVAVVVVVRKRSKESVITSMPSMSPTPISEQDYLLQLFGPISGKEMLLNETSASNQAMKWMLQQDEDGLFPVKTHGVGVLTDRFALATLYFATNGPSDWVEQTGFLSDLPVCEWPPLNTTLRKDLLNRVDCNEDGRVIGVNFKENNLTGTLPKEIGSMESLANLMIQLSALTGTLPSDLFDLTLLTRLSFNRNQLSGTILNDEDWRRLRLLQWLDLGLNRFSGTIPSAITDNENLLELRLYENNFISTLPTFASRSALRNVLLWNNNLTGELPNSLFALRQLEHFAVDGNSFSGTLSTRIGNLARSLWWIDLGYNDFEGSLPSEIGLLTQLKIFNSHWTSFNSTLPTTISNMNQLEDFGIIGNAISGQIPSEIGLLERTLKFLSLPVNSFTGTIPTELTRLSKLEFLFLSSNSLSGTVPTQFQEISSLQALLIQNNSLTGNFDQAICGLPKISVGYFEADCLALSPLSGPEINCTCCSTCHNDIGQTSSTDKSESQRLCEGFIAYGESNYNLSCSCNEIDEGEPVNPAGQYPKVQLDCISPGDECLSCNEFGDICAMPGGGGSILYEDVDGNNVGISAYTEFQYVTGQSEKIYFEYANELSIGKWCQFAINDQYCKSCTYGVCNDGASAHLIDCSNILSEASTYIPATYNGCQAERENLGVFDAVYVYESKLSSCSVNMGGLER